LFTRVSEAAGVAASLRKHRGHPGQELPTFVGLADVLDELIP
jgi:hypothetical protein